MIKRRECLKVGLMGLVGIATAPWSFAQSQPVGPVRRQLRLTVTLTNPTPHELLGQTVWLYVPAAETPTQKLDALTVSMPHERLRDPLGHSIVRLALPRMAALASKVVGIAAVVQMARTPTPAPLANPQDWLGSERYIETTDARIQALAAELKRPAERDSAKASYDWIRQHLQSEAYVAGDRGAVDALDKRRGDCTEYAYLAVALARANGIPARMVGGYVTDRDAVLRAEDYHNWVEVYVDGAWRLLDAQKGRWLAPTEQYVAFRFFRDQAVNPIGLAHRYKVEGGLELRF